MVERLGLRLDELISDHSSMDRIGGNDNDSQAHTLKQDTARHPRHWGWTLWEGKVKVGLTRKCQFHKLVSGRGGWGGVE